MVLKSKVYTPILTLGYTMGALTGDMHTGVCQGHASNRAWQVSEAGASGVAQAHCETYPMWVNIWALFSPSHCRAKPKSQSFSSGGSSSDSSVLSSLRSLPGHTHRKGA